MEEFVLGLDLDGVTCNYEAGFRWHVARSLGIREEELGPITTWKPYEAWEQIKDESHYMELHTNAVRDGLFRSLQPMEGASKALWELSDKGVHIRVVTHRFFGNGNHQVVAADTVAWLDRHEIPYRDLCFLGSKSQLHADVFIDDAPHNVDAISKGGGKVIIFDAAYNQGVAGPRVKNWQEAKALILDMQAEWKEARGE